MVAEKNEAAFKDQVWYIYKSFLEPNARHQVLFLVESVLEFLQSIYNLPSTFRGDIIIYVSSKRDRTQYGVTYNWHV